MSKEIEFSLSRKAMIGLWRIEWNMNYPKYMFWKSRWNITKKLIKDLIKPPKMRGLFG